MQITNSTKERDEQDDDFLSKQSEFFRPDESDRLAQAKKWFEQALGEARESKE